MAVLKGKRGVVGIAGSTALFAELKEWSVTTSATTTDSTKMGDDWELHEQVLLSWEGKATCFYDPVDADGQVVAVAGASLTIHFYPNGVAVAANARKLVGLVTVEKVERSAMHNGLIEVSFSFKGNGALVDSAA
jgi:hypothetical protein